MAVATIIVYLIFWGMQILFRCKFEREIEGMDKSYVKWKREKRNTWIHEFIQNVGQFLSWKIYKLLYSHFFGWKIKTAEFDRQRTFEKIMRDATIINVVGIYLPLILICVIGLLSYSWGDQLYVMLVENILISLVMMVCHFIEYKRMITAMFADKKRRSGVDDQLRLMSALQEEDGQSKKSLLNKMKNSAMFVELTVNELLDEFGGRYCKTCDGRYTRGDFDKT